MSDMKTIVIPQKPRYRILHVEAPGCIVNIHLGLHTDSGHPVTRVNVEADRYIGDKWHLPDFPKNQEGIGVRVVKIDNDDGKPYVNTADPVCPNLYEILRMGAEMSIPWDKGGIHVHFRRADDPDKFIATFPTGEQIQYDLTERNVSNCWDEMRKYDGTFDAYYNRLVEKYVHLAFDDFESGQAVDQIVNGVLALVIRYHRKDGHHEVRYYHRFVRPILEAMERDGIDDPNDVADNFADIPQHEG